MIGGYHNGGRTPDSPESHQIFLPFFEWHDTEAAAAAMASRPHFFTESVRKMTDFVSVEGSWDENGLRNPITKPRLEFDEATVWLWGHQRRIIEGLRMCQSRDRQEGSGSPSPSLSPESVPFHCSASPELLHQSTYSLSCIKLLYIIRTFGTCYYIV